VRSVSPTCASSDKAGWQQVKMRRSRSSGISPRSRPGASTIGSDAKSGSASSFSFRRVCRRRRSMALCLAVWMIQARGESGTPSVRHWSTAAVKASCAASSASSKSPNWRMRVATIRPQSDRYTASTATLGFGSTFDDKKIYIAMSIGEVAIRFSSGGTQLT